LIASRPINATGAPRRGDQTIVVDLRLLATRLLALWLLCLFARPGTGALANDPAPLFDADGYRIDEFLAPVPATAPGATTVTTAQVQALHADAQTLLIDVLPAPPRPAGLSPTDLWLPPPRLNIPGSVWLPNVGYGRLSAELTGYLERNLARLTGGDHGRRLIVYCRADCWMSWNAAKRLAAAGYTAVYWYPEGTTGWEAAGLRLEASRPAASD
jgi:PQQ-dependent catabolism-associated CXXCW motif protein